MRAKVESRVGSQAWQHTVARLGHQTPRADAGHEQQATQPYSGVAARAGSPGAHQRRRLELPSGAAWSRPATSATTVTTGTMPTLEDQTVLDDHSDAPWSSPAAAPESPLDSQAMQLRAPPWLAAAALCTVSPCRVSLCAAEDGVRVHIAPSRSHQPNAGPASTQLIRSAGQEAFPAARTPAVASTPSERNQQYVHAPASKGSTRPPHASPIAAAGQRPKAPSPRLLKSRGAGAEHGHSTVTNDRGAAAPGLAQAEQAFQAPVATSAALMCRSSSAPGLPCGPLLPDSGSSPENVPPQQSVQRRHQTAACGQPAQPHRSASSKAQSVVAVRARQQASADAPDHVLAERTTRRRRSGRDSSADTVAQLVPGADSSRKHERPRATSALRSQATLDSEPSWTPSTAAPPLRHVVPLSDCRPPARRYNKPLASAPACERAKPLEIVRAATSARERLETERSKRRSAGQTHTASRAETSMANSQHQSPADDALSIAIALHRAASARILATLETANYAAPAGAATHAPSEQRRHHEFGTCEPEGAAVVAASVIDNPDKAPIVLARVSSPTAQQRSGLEVQPHLGAKRGAAQGALAEAAPRVQSPTANRQLGHRHFGGSHPLLVAGANGGLVESAMLTQDRNQAAMAACPDARIAMCDSLVLPSRRCCTRGIEAETATLCNSCVQPS